MEGKGLGHISTSWMKQGQQRFAIIPEASTSRSLQLTFVIPALLLRRRWWVGGWRRGLGSKDQDKDQQSGLGVIGEATSIELKSNNS
jgi:hypothetical protein